MNGASFTEVKGRGPPTRVCYICGRPYGINSYDIHLKQCKDLWIAREELKDPKERKPLPQDPILYASNNGNNNGNGNGKQNNNFQNNLSIEELNRLASESFNTVSLEKCTVCGRTFLPEKLLIHQRACTVDHPARRIDESVRREVAASLSPSFTKHLPNVSLNCNNSNTNNNNIQYSSPQQNARPQTAQASSSSGGRSLLMKPSAVLKSSYGDNTDSQSNYNSNSNNDNSNNDEKNSNNINNNYTNSNKRTIGYSNSNLAATLSAIQLEEEDANGTSNHSSNNSNNNNNKSTTTTLIKALEQKVISSESKIDECLHTINHISIEVTELKAIVNQLFTLQRNTSSSSSARNRL